VKKIVSFYYVLNLQQSTFIFILFLNKQEILENGRSMNGRQYIRITNYNVYVHRRELSTPIVYHYQRKLTLSYILSLNINTTYI
jgi:hypothetical protein